MTKNKLERFPNHFANLTALADLHASENCIEVLPENFGKKVAGDDVGVACNTKLTTSLSVSRIYEVSCSNKT